jgi:hypothetical protein
MQCSEQQFETENKKMALMRRMSDGSPHKITEKEAKCLFWLK